MDVIDKLGKVLWKYHHLNQKIKKADIILCFTSVDLSVPKYCAKLYKENFAPRVLISGGNAMNASIPDNHNIQRTSWGTDSEAEKYAELIINEGVPKEKVLLETKSSNSGENVLFSYQLLENMHLLPKSVLLVHKPTMERRAYASFKKWWPDTHTSVTVTSMPYTYEEYVGKIVDREVIINIMVGDIQRIINYPQLGYQIYQEVPKIVLNAYNELIDQGYDKHIMRDLPINFT